MPFPLIPAIGAVASGILGYFQNKGQNDAENRARQLYNDYLNGRKEAFNELISMAQAHGYDPFGPQVTTGTSQGTSASQSAYGSTTRSKERQGKDIAAEYQPMEERFRSLIEGRLGKATTVSEGEKAAALRAINEANKAAGVKVGNVAARYGQSGAQVAGAMTPLEIARSGQAASYLGSEVPQEERRRRNEDLAIAQGAIGAFGTEDWRDALSRTQGTSSTTGTTAGTSTTTAPPDLQGLFSMMAPQAPQAGPTGYSPALGTGQDLLSSLLQLYANRKPSTQQTNPGIWT